MRSRPGRGCASRGGGGLSGQALGGVGVGLDLDGLTELAAGVAVLADGPHPAGDGAVQASGEEGAGLGDALAAPYPLTGGDHGLGGYPQVLVEGQHVAAHEGHALGGQVRGQGLVFVGVDPVGEVAAQA